MTTRNAPQNAPTQDAESQAAMTPAQALELLRQGNTRFLTGDRAVRDLHQQVVDTAEGQWPFAIVLSCIDSRAPAELIFDQGLGDLFNVRLAGNTISEGVLGSMEFACAVAGAKLIVVMGHSRCGAVKGACDGAELGHLTALLERLKPALAAVTEPADPAERTSANVDFVQDVADANVELTCKNILEHSQVLAGAVAAGEVGLVGAMYDVAAGEVRFDVAVGLG
ncbi:MAG: carbonic anhydrase [Planctomycetota bacterium]|nr:MAG: carbonic anhydrase [Planctomycetota bacterium]